MSVQSQKDTANKIYECLSIIDPSCVLAGGAPRDWYFGNECNDLDFYFCSTASIVERTRNQLARVGLTAKPSVCPAQSELYHSMPGLTRIWDGEFYGMKVQLIQMATPKDRWNVVENMDVSICKAWYSQNGHIHLHQDFKLTVASKVMFLKENYCWENKHGKKMQERFQGKFAAGTKEQAQRSLISKVLMEVV